MRTNRIIVCAVFVCTQLAILTLAVARDDSMLMLYAPSQVVPFLVFLVLDAVIFRFAPRQFTEDIERPNASGISKGDVYRLCQGIPFFAVVMQCILNFGMLVIFLTNRPR
jgi:hypothetical protein